LLKEKIPDIISEVFYY